jgi:dolichyl-phosphate beta-glucosyltransferase
MLPERVDLSIILSCYNESSLIESSLSKLISLLNTTNTSYEIIIIDDFSRDESVKTIRSVQTENDRIRLICNPHNMGKGFSIKNGVLNSIGKYIIFTDIDMVYSLENIKIVLDELNKGSDIVIGNRRLDDSIYIVPNRLIKYVYRRHFVGVVFNIIVRYLFGIKIKDTQSGLKGFNRETAITIFSNVNTNRFVFDVEIFILAKNLNKTVKEIPVQLTYFSQRSTLNILKYSLKAIFEVLSIKFYQIRGKYSKDSIILRDYGDHSIVVNNDIYEEPTNISSQTTNS